MAWHKQSRGVKRRGEHADAAGSGGQHNGPPCRPPRAASAAAAAASATCSTPCRSPVPRGGRRRRLEFDRSSEQRRRRRGPVTVSRTRRRAEQSRAEPLLTHSACACQCLCQRPVGRERVFLCALIAARRFTPRRAAHPDVAACRRWRARARTRTGRVGEARRQLSDRWLRD